MANPHRGEVAFEAAGQSWSLRFSTNALCTLENDLDLGIGEIVETMQTSPRLSTLRAVLRAGLSQEIDQRRAGELIDELGFDRVRELISDAFALAFPSAVEAEAEDVRPRKGAKAGGGGNSLLSSSA